MCRDRRLAERTAGEGYASALQQSSSGHHGDASLLPSNTGHGLLRQVILRE
jgi:hypothetical protein